MKLTSQLEGRVRQELTAKLLTGGMSGDPKFQPQVEATVAGWIEEIERWLASVTDLSDAGEFTQEELAELEVAVAISEVSDPELAATFEAARNGTLDVEGITADITEGFEAAFRHFCGEQGLTTRTIELLLAYRQAQIPVNG